MTQRTFLWHFNIHQNYSVPRLQYWAVVGEKQRLPQKENLQEESLHLELLRTSNKCVRLLSEVLGDQQAELTLH